MTNKETPLEMNTQIDGRHGGAYDRGRADYYYGRGYRAHYYVAATGTSAQVIPAPGSPEAKAYALGWAAGEEWGEKKDWGFRE